MKKLKLFVTTITAIFISTISVHATVVELGQDDFKTNIESGGEYKLKENINISDIIEIDDNLILDLNGKTITGTAARIFNIRNGNVTLKNGTIKNENISSDAAIIYIYGHSSGTGI